MDWDDVLARARARAEEGLAKLSAPLPAPHPAEDKRAANGTPATGNATSQGRKPKSGQQEKSKTGGARLGGKTGGKTRGG